MATKSPTQTESLSTEMCEHNRRLDERLQQLRLPFRMNVRRYRFAELLLALAILLSGIYGVWEGGDPTILIGLAITAAAGLSGLKLTELYTTYQDGKVAQQQTSDPDGND